MKPAGRTVFVCAHGAGGHMDDRGMRSLSEVLQARGLDVARFNFAYREQGSRRPDPMPVLKSCFIEAIARARAALQPARLLIGGRSMGGRVASMLAADGVACDGLLLFAYPLHPAGNPEKLRDEHLPRIQVPVLCFNGTRDALCRRDLMEQAMGTVRTPWEMHWLEGAGHSFEVTDEVGEVLRSWLARLPAV